MFVEQFNIYESKSYPLLNHSLYQKIAEEFALPQPELLLKSTRSDVDLGRSEFNKLEVHFLDNLIDVTETDLFQVRFAYSKNARDKIALFISFRGGIAHNISVQFPGRSGRSAFSRILAALKSACHTLHIDQREVRFEVSGFPETGRAGWIREHSLSAFVWVEVLNRYIHVKENPNEMR